MACGRTIGTLCAELFRQGLRPNFSRIAAIGIVFAALGVPCSAEADPIKARLTVDVSGGYARLIFNTTDDIDAAVRVAGNVMIISFQRPIDVSVDRLATQAPDYIGAARRDPDGKAIRVALAQKLKVNSMSAGEKFFVDLLPDSWVGAPPGLPQDVVEELARRAREAERLMRQERQMAERKKPAPVRVHVATQPTFTRYVFNLPDQTSVSADSAKDRLTLTFDAPLKFDLADAQAALPRAIGAINSELEDASAIVRFNFVARVDLRTFRDDKGYVVDVVGANAKPDEQSEAPADGAQPAAAPETTPPANSKGEAAPNGIDALAAQMQNVLAEPPAAIGAQSPPPQQLLAPRAVPPAQAPPQPALSSPAMQMTQPPRAAPQLQPAAKAVVQPAPPPSAQLNSPPPSTSARSAPATTTPPNSAPQTPAAAAVTPPSAKTVQQAGPPPVAPAPQPAAAAQVNAPAAPREAETQVDAAKTELPVATEQPAPPVAPGSAAPTPSGAAAARVRPNGAVAVELVHQGADLKLSFPFKTPTAAAVFQRADTLWIVFDSKADIDLGALEGESSRTIRGTDLTRAPDADIVRIKLDRPHLSSVAIEGPLWTVEIGDFVLEPSHALDIARNMIGHNRASVTIPFEEPHQLHRITDPEVGDSLLVVTAFAPARGFINTQDFIEFRALASTQGVVVEPLADDINMEIAADKIVISRPTGLTLSTSLQTVLRGSGLRPAMFDSQIWGSDREGSYDERQSRLIAAAAAAPDNKRLAPRLDLARFYIARDMYPEAKGVLDVALANERPPGEDVSATVLRAIAEIMMNRPDDALRDLADPAVGGQHDAPLWRALAYARQGKWAQAREGFKRVEAAMATLPIELQRVALKDEMRAAIEVGDYAGAGSELDDFETIGVPHEMEPEMAVLMGRLAEGMGRTEDALTAYRTAADSWDRPAAAQGRLRETELRYSLGDLKRDYVINELESLTTIWRGDETEVEALQVLARLYTEEGRYRDSFYVMRSAMAAHPDSDLTRKIQDEAATTFDSLFLAGRGDTMPAIEALALFYDFRELTPIGRRGDEMIRRLADRLVSVDLLDQAADLLQYQIDHRLQGAARAQVATRLAVIYLMNRKADRALATLRATRTADVSNELRNQRLLLEGRALSDLGRHDVALEVIANIDGREAIRLRSDILWAARRWRELAEQIELMYGDRWKEWQPLNEVERSDILRAEIGYALAEDKLGLGRFREKYTAKMAQTPDAHAFEIVSAPLGTSGDAFAAIAHAAASGDTLDSFLRDMNARYPESGATSPPAAPDGAQPSPPAAAPVASPGTKRAPEALQAPETRPVAPAGPPAPPPRASGRTAQR